MRQLILGFVLALAMPANPQAGGHVSIFYYPWYGTVARDGSYQHWGQDGHAPPDDIASSFYPAQGVYSSSSRRLVDRQMGEIAAAGVDEVVVSWWGRGSPEDARLPLVVSAARRNGLSVAVHIEPYAGRTVDTVTADVTYLRLLGITTFYVYRALDLPVADWAASAQALHAGGAVLYAQTALVGAAAAAGFDGVYTYDIVTYGGNTFPRICDEAHRLGLLCAPSVGPGYDARRGSGDPRVKPRRGGATYDAMWNAAIAAGADDVTITSFNEWHEGTQIEPASPPSRHGRYRYGSYNGAWGRYGAAAETAYLDRTSYWTSVFRSTSAVQLNTSPS
jgi:glycoprotein endo-alpha-1,2-mannosidase